MKTALVCGADGFVGHHLVNRLKNEGYWVRGVDLTYETYARSVVDDFIIQDLRKTDGNEKIFDRPFDEVYQLAADMGGAGYLFTGENDADIMSNSILINLNILNVCRKKTIKKIFYSSSACVYPEYNQMDPQNPTTAEDTTYPAKPDSEYGWEKLFSERLYLAYHRCYQVEVRIARLHNIFGPECSWDNGKEKSPAALCRKIAEASDGGQIEIWGDGKQTRSYLYIDECLEAIRRLMQSNYTHPLNIGSEEKVSIDELAHLLMQISGKTVTLKHIAGPEGVRGRTSNNQLIQQILNWTPTQPLATGLQKTYAWVMQQVTKKKLIIPIALQDVRF